MFGVLICTTVSDKFGRKPIILISHAMALILGVANALSPNYYVFIVLRFFGGIFLHVGCRYTSFLVLKLKRTK